MNLAQTASDFLSNPFDPNGDGRTSLVELFFAVGLIVVLVFAWNRILSYFDFSEA